MPGYDGTGPRGQGPFTGGGRGYCAMVLPPYRSSAAPYGYAGLQGAPIGPGVRAPTALGRRWFGAAARWPRPYGRGLYARRSLGWPGRPGIGRGRRPRW